MNTTQILLITRGKTDWDDTGRIQGDLDIPLNSKGEEIMMERAREVRRFDVAAVYSAKELPAVQTANIIANATGCSVHPCDDLNELNQGHWQGLSHEDVKCRHPKAYRQWLNAPLSVCPPHGETIASAYDRVQRQIKKIVRKHRDQCVAIVCSPLTTGLARCFLKGLNLAEIWSVHSDVAEWELLEVARR